MAAVQTMMDFCDPRRGRRVSAASGAREHFRTTTLTVPKGQYERVTGRNGTECEIDFVNDVVSSCRGEQSRSVHHSIRRIDLLRRQWRGGFRKVNVRYRQGETVTCEMLGIPHGESDSCCGRVLVRRARVVS